MSVTLIDTIRTARKEYRCDASEIFRDAGLGPDDMDEDGDWEIVQKAKADGWVIKSGDKYRFVRSIESGLFETYRARLDMDDLCMRLDFCED